MAGRETRRRERIDTSRQRVEALANVVVADNLH